jgi:hypothetical protein
MSAPAIVAPAERPPRRTQLARYALWQLRDYSVMRGLPTFLISGMFGAVTLVPMVRGIARQMANTPATAMAKLVARHGSTDAVRDWLLHDLSKGFLRGYIGSVVFLGALFAMNGLVSNDRKLGYYRFLFSKPVAPTRYYGQAFLVHWAGFLVVATLLAAIYSLYAVNILTPTFIAALGLVYLMYAGVAFLMTVVVRWDWLGLAGTMIAAQVLWGAFGESDSVFARLLYLLPPIHRTGDVYTAIIMGTAMPMRTLAWLVGYGVAAFAAGLLALRVQRLAIP